MASRARAAEKGLPLPSRQGVLDITDRLVSEFAGAAPAGSVLRCVARCRQEAIRAGLRSEAVEALARHRLELRRTRYPPAG